MISTMFKFLFGTTKEEVQRDMDKDDDFARNLLDNIEDE